MITYLIRRIVTSIIVVIGVSIFIFLLLHAAYPSPARAVLGLQARPAQIAAWNKTRIEKQEKMSTKTLEHRRNSVLCFSSFEEKEFFNRFFLFWKKERARAFYKARKRYSKRMPRNRENNYNVDKRFNHNEDQMKKKHIEE